MALKAVCAHCKRTFSAPEQYRGKKIECPACRKRFILRTDDDISAEAQVEEEERRKQEVDRERIALIERMDAKSQHRPRSPYYEEFQIAPDEVRHFNPRAPSRFLRFRSLSDFLVLGAYCELLLVAVGCGLMIYLRISGAVSSVAVLFVLLVGWLIIGIALYLLLKYLGELAYLLAEVGDQHNDLVQLLLDIRENTDRRGVSED